MDCYIPSLVDYGVPSSLDPQLSVTPDQWAVTITCDVGNNHARLVFEGVDEDNYFYRIAHLRGPSQLNPAQGCFLGKDSIGIVDIDKRKEKKEFKSLYGYKSETWIQSRKKIEALMLEIEEEHSQEIPFNICGNRSVFSKKVEIYEIYDPVLAKIKNQDLNLFLRLFDSAQNSGHCTGMSRNEFDKFISSALSKINGCPKNLTYSTLIPIIQNCSKVFSEFQNSCFTWARCKVAKLGIKLNDQQLENIISITTYYINNEPNEEIKINSTVNHRCKVIETRQRKLYERFVSYDVNRDRRTEEAKFIKKSSTVNEVFAHVCDGATIVSYALITPAIVTPFLLFTAPLIAIPATVVGIGMLCISRFGHEQLREEQSRLIQGKDAVFSQPGNKGLDVHYIKKTFQGQEIDQNSNNIKNKTDELDAFNQW